MVCPLMVAGRMTKATGDEAENQHFENALCGKDICAWWIKETGECAVLGIARWWVIDEMEK